MQSFSRRQLAVLVALTLVWGINWPVMKIGVGAMPPLTFRTLSLWLSLPVLALAVAWTKVPLRVPRKHWPELLLLTATNMLIWHSLIIVAVKSLSSGRAAILGYTMPIFAAVFGAAFLGIRLLPRAWCGVAAAAAGVLLLLWHELSNLAGRPVAVLMTLAGAATWAAGTHLLKRSRLPVPTLAIAFWMTALTALFLSLLAVVFERAQWAPPPRAAWGGIAYNAVLIFGFAHAAWFWLARDLPPVASTLSVMFIPVVGVFGGALWLGEVLHWQDWAAVLLLVLAIASVLWPQRAAPAR